MSAISAWVGISAFFAIITKDKKDRRNWLLLLAFWLCVAIAEDLKNLNII